jgi:uncharacterized protein involved in exopolysaccharide biosynthesis
VAEQVVWATKRVTLAVPVPSVAALRTRVWLVGPPLLLALLGAVLAIQAPKQTFRSQSEVIFRSGPSVRLEQDMSPAAVRVARGKPTEVVAHSPALAERVIRAAGVPGITPAQFLRHSDAKLQPQPGGEALLALSVSYRHRDAAVRLANAYAAQFTRFQAEINRNSLDPLLRWYQARIEALAARGQTGAAYRYRDLLATKHELERQARNAVVLENAEGAAKVHPHALRNGLLGGALGALIGVVLTVGVAARRRRVS